MLHTPRGYLNYYCECLLRQAIIMLCTKERRLTIIQYSSVNNAIII